MQKNQASEERNRSLLINITVVLVFVGLMLGFISYLNDSSPDLRRLTLERLTERFTTSVNNAHWQWQAEGRPQIVMLVTYANKLGDDKELVEKERTPVFINHLGWPKAEPTSQGCAEIWDMVLNLPMEIDGFKIIAEYYDGIKLTDSVLDSRCRYRLSTGPYFEYKVYSGQVLKVTQ